MRRTWFSGDAEHTTNHPEAGTCRPRVHKHAEGEGWTVCCPVHLHLQPLYLADWAELSPMPTDTQHGPMPCLAHKVPGTSTGASAPMRWQS
jgi:hypothetical protein